jgi:hypothetical protein
MGIDKIWGRMYANGVKIVRNVHATCAGRAARNFGLEAAQP